MSWATSYLVDGLSLAFQGGMRFTIDGVVLSPDVNLDDPEVLSAIKKGLRVYSLVAEIEAFLEYAYEFNSDTRVYEVRKKYRNQKHLQIASQLGQRWSEYSNVPNKALQTYIIEAQSPLPKKSKRIKKQTKPGYVYLIRSDKGFKIGYTLNPERRLKTFTVKLPFEIKPECFIKTPDMIKLESQLHDRFADKRLNGEWFDLSEDDVEYIKSLAEQSHER